MKNAKKTKGKKGSLNPANGHIGEVVTKAFDKFKPKPLSNLPPPGNRQTTRGASRKK